MKPPVQYAMMPPRVDAPKVGKMKPVQQPKVAKMRGIDEALDYYLGPTGIPDRLAAVNQMFNPVEAVGGSMRASQRLFAPETDGWGRVQAAGDMLSGIGGFVAPMVAAAKVGAPAASAVVDAFTGISTAPATQAAKTTATDFAMKDDGGVRVWTGGAGDPMKAAADRGAWFSEAEDLAKEYAGSTGRVSAAEIDPRNPIAFRHAEQSRPIGDVISTALEGAADSADLDAVRPIVDRLTARYGTTSRPLFEYWNQDKDVADLFRALGYDAISVAEKSDMKAKTWAALDPSIVNVAPMRPVTPAQDVARLLSEGRASDVTEEMRAAADPQEMWNLYKTGATGMDMPVDHASRMARAKDMGHDTDAYHASRSDADFAAFRPGARGSTYFAPTPNGAVSGASGQALEMAGSAPGDQSVRFVMPTKVRSQDVKGLTVNNDAFAALPDVITDESTIKAIAGDVRKAGLEYWDDAYEAVRFGDSYRYYKRDAPALSYQDLEPGKDAFGYRLGSFNTGSDESGLALANTVGKRGFLVADEGGSSIVAGPNMPVRSRFAMFDPRLKHLANLSAAGVGAAYLAPDERRGIKMGQ